VANYRVLHPSVPEDKVRNVLGLSGGKDSAALVVYIRDRYQEIHEEIECFSQVPVQSYLKCTMF